jgi:secreted protein with Ig-like and vWFA domain
MAAALLAGCGHTHAALAADANDERGPNIALMILIDRSGSMSGDKIGMTRRAARAAVDALGDEDLAGVIAFDSVATTVVRLERVGPRRPEIAAAIATIEPGGGTQFYPALKSAQEFLLGVRAPLRHVLLLSDGQAAYDGLAHLAADMRREGVTISTVGIGDADEKLLKMIADAGAGAAYVVTDLGTLPGIFVADLKRERGAKTNER